MHLSRLLGGELRLLIRAKKLEGILWVASVPFEMLARDVSERNFVQPSLGDHNPRSR